MQKFKYILWKHGLTNSFKFGFRYRSDLHIGQESASIGRSVIFKVLCDNRATNMKDSIKILAGLSKGLPSLYNVNLLENNDKKEKEMKPLGKTLLERLQRIDYPIHNGISVFEDYLKACLLQVKELTTVDFESLPLNNEDYCKCIF